MFKPLLIFVVLVERIIMLQRSRSFCFKNIKDSLFRSIIALEAWDYAKIWFKKKSETRGKNGQVSKVELGLQRYPPEWKNGHVSDSRIRGTLCPLEKKRKKERD